ncbi:MAG: hypothetical protein KKF12_04555 [Proteobacteria bacterium]|nr:hypothetical protein [Desulfobacula sp.]MBU3953114.1 hypothetical protein [Pseudomonadota bacterium]MBU4130070.1 hypothetical protein [Pseudomonadota bacterium]
MSFPKNVSQVFSFLLFLGASLVFCSCAGHPRTGLSQITPAENLPQIGVRQATVFTKHARPDSMIFLTEKAEQQIRSNQLDEAFATLERALGIDAQDPFPWHFMAKIQLLRGNLQQAEHLARKSNILAARYPTLVEKNKDIIARAMGQQSRLPMAPATPRE